MQNFNLQYVVLINIFTSVIICIRKECINMTYTADLIAKWFLARNKCDMNDCDSEAISNLKLQKLLYYAQGCTLALTGEALFNDEIVAWKHGPVIESIYQEYKNNGSCGIEFNEEFNSNDIDISTQNILEEVYQTFGQFSAWKLRDMTHQESPWIETKQSDIINKEKIKKYFMENYITQ